MISTILLPITGIARVVMLSVLAKQAHDDHACFKQWRNDNPRFMTSRQQLMSLQLTYNQRSTRLQTQTSKKDELDQTRWYPFFCNQLVTDDRSRDRCSADKRFTADTDGRDGLLWERTDGIQLGRSHSYSEDRRKAYSSAGRSVTVRTDKRHTVWENQQIQWWRTEGI